MNLRGATTLLLVVMTALPAGAMDANFCRDKGTGLYPDPQNCAKYYNCYNGNTYSLDCPTSLYFSVEISACDWPSNVKCVTAPPPTSTSTTTTTRPTTMTSTTTTPTTTTTPKSSTSTTSTTSKTNTTTLTATTTTPKTNATTPTTTTTTASTTTALKPPSPLFCRDKADGLYPDPAYCNFFYKCNGGYAYRLKCGQGLLYNKNYQYCDWSYNVECAPEQLTAPAPVTTTNPISRQPTSSSQPLSRNCGRVVCFVPNWAKYRFGDGAFSITDVNPFLCTHAIYAFAKLSGNRLVATESGDEPQGDDIGNFARVTNLKNVNPGLKVLLAVGGWGMGTTAFSLMASAPNRREEFVNTTIQFLRQRRFDGLDFDWEYPTSANDRDNFATLCEQLRAAFNAEASGDQRLILTAAVVAGKAIIDSAYDVPRLSAAVDFFNLMSYDFHGSWDQRTGHHSALKRGSWESSFEESLNVEWVAQYWVSKGAPKNKLVVGAPLYARTFSLISTSNVSVGSFVSGAGSPGPYTATAGVLSYYEVCLQRAVSRQYFIESQRVPFLVYGDQWVGYEDQSSLREKVKFVKTNGYGGLMVWELSHDDFNGRFCQEGAYPLLNAIVDECSK